MGGQLMVVRVIPRGPAEKAGVQSGDVVLGVGGETAKDLADFYRKVWALGSAGTTVPVDVMQDSGKRRIDIHSMGRYGPSQAQVDVLIILSSRNSRQRISGTQCQARQILCGSWVPALSCAQAGMTAAWIS